MTSQHQLQASVGYHGMRIPGGPSRDNSLADEEELDRFFGGSYDDKAASSDDGSLLSDRDDEAEYDNPVGPNLYQTEHRRLLDHDASIIPGSPFSKPPVVATSRPSDTLPVARIISSTTLLMTSATVAFLIYICVVSYESATRIVFGSLLAVTASFGMYGSFRTIISSFFTMFIPARAFQTNTKFSSIIPEEKLTHSPWMDVTIQIPVMNEPLNEILMPTFRSFIAARDHYVVKSGARCNIVVCDDHLMVLLRDNFAVVELLWNEIVRTQGQLFHLGTIIRSLPRPVRQHLKGLSSRAVHEAFYRMLFYFHNKIGFVARALYDRRREHSLEENLNSHLRLVFGSQHTLDEDEEISSMEARLNECHNEDGSRFVMFGNDIELGELLVVGGADMRISPELILQTVPEFMNDDKLAFTQHAVSAKKGQRGESYFTRMMAASYDFVYRGHHLFSSVMGCHPPLSLKAVTLRTSALRQCGKVRMLRKTQRWLKNIGIEFLPVDQVGFGNLSKNRHMEYWAEDQIWSGFEAMMELYNLGFNGRYCPYPNSEFQIGIPRTFNEFSWMERRASMGANEVVFNSFPDMIGGRFIFSALFKTLVRSGIPSYYKDYLVSLLFSYLTGGAFFFCFVVEAIIRILHDVPEPDNRYYNFSASSAIAALYIVALVWGNVCFAIGNFRLRRINKSLMARKRGCFCSTGGDLTRYFFFQVLVQPVTSSAFCFLGAMDHLFVRSLASPLRHRFLSYRKRYQSVRETIWWNIGSWYLAMMTGGLAYAAVVREKEWDPRAPPSSWVRHAMFSGPAIALACVLFLAPIVLNPYIWGFPFVWQKTEEPGSEKGGSSSPREIPIKDIGTFLQASRELDERINHLETRPDVEITSNDLQTAAGSSERVIYNRHISPDPEVVSMLRSQTRERRERVNVDHFGFPVSDGSYHR